MKKFFTFKKSLFVAAMLLMAVGVQAQLKYVPLYGQLKAYPVGAGKVYAEMSGLGVAPEGANYAEPADEVNVKFACRGVQPNGNYKGYAVPNEGWVLAGFATQKYEDGEPMIPTEVEWTDNPRTLKLTSQVYAKADMTSTPEEAFQMFPNDPDEVHYALFTRVTVGIDAFNSNLGSVAIDKAVNDVGTEITLTATPDYTKKASFLHWVEKSTGNKITQNPYTVTVKGAEHYEAVFTSENLFAVEFPAEGGYVEYYKEENLAYFPSTVLRVNCMNEDLKKKDEVGYLEIENYKEAIPAMTPTYFYGQGTQYFLDDPSDKTSTMFYFGTPLEKWSGDDGIELSTYTITIKIPVSFYEDKDSVVADINGYLLDTEKNVFERVASGFVPANRVFLAIPVFFLDQIEEGFIPDFIYLSEEDAQVDGIDNVTEKNAAKNGKIFTLDGKQVTSPKQKGVYIYDGKKLIFRK